MYGCGRFAYALFSWRSLKLSNNVLLGSLKKMYALIEIFVGILAANFNEWFIHKYIFHGLGKKTKLFSEHWSVHHKETRSNGHYDSNYKTCFREWNDKTSEIAQLTLFGLTYIPTFFYFPYFVTTLWVSALLYFYLHRRSHLEPEWAKKHLVWHYDHHMGKDQDSNWCVTFPLFDYILGTRRKYVGTDEERADLLKRELKLKGQGSVRVLTRIDRRSVG